MRYIKFGKINLDIFIPIVLIISYLGGFVGQLIMAYLAVFIHEAAHAFVALIFRCKVKRLYFLSFGTKIELEINIESRFSKCLIYAAGPLINFLVAIVTMFFMCNFNQEIMKAIVITNLCLGFFNLLPLSPLDGGEILSIFTYSRYGLFYSQKISHITFILVIILLSIISIPFALFYNNLSILILAIFLLFKDRKYEKAAFTNARNLYYRRARLIKKGYYGVREIVVLERLTLGDAFKLMDFDQYHLLIVLNDNMKIVHRLTESELLSALNDFGYGCTFKELITKSMNS